MRTRYTAEPVVKIANESDIAAQEKKTRHKLIAGIGRAAMGERHLFDCTRGIKCFEQTNGRSNSFFRLRLLFARS